jgi:hypothetical protein
VSLFLCQLVVSKDFVTCPSCLHTQSDDSCRYANDGECDEPTSCPYGTDTSDCSGGGAPDVDCFTRRKDEKVCCGNSRWVESPRYCHSPSAASVEYSKYTTCESACRRNGVPNSQYYALCKDAVSGSRKATMTTTPSSETEANQQAWCDCVEKCLSCTGSSGGIGERPTQMTSLNHDYRYIHGTCAPPPASWITTTVAVTPPPNAIFQATDFQCDANTPSGTFLLPNDMILYLMRPLLIHKRARAHSYAYAHMRVFWE